MGCLKLKQATCRYEAAVEQTGRLEARLEAVSFSSREEQSQLTGEVRRREDVIGKLQSQHTALQNSVNRQQDNVSRLLTL